MPSKFVSFLSASFPLFPQTYFLYGCGWLNGTTLHKFYKWLCSYPKRAWSHFLRFQNSHGRNDWPSLGQVPFSDCPLAMVKGKHWLHQHGTSTITIHTCEGANPQVMDYWNRYRGTTWQDTYRSHSALDCIPAIPWFLIMWPEIQDISVLTIPSLFVQGRP